MKIRANDIKIKEFKYNVLQTVEFIDDYEKLKIAVDKYLH